MNSKFAVALDIGNESTVCAIPSKYGVDVVQDQMSKRQVPSVVTLNDRRILCGDIALQEQSQNLNCTITHIKSLIGLKFDSEECEKIKNSLPFFLVKMNNGYAGISLHINGEWKVIDPIVFLAFVIFDAQKRIELFRPETKGNKEYIFVTEPWWGQVERNLVLECAKIAGIKISRFVNSTTSAAVNFSFEHAKLIPTDSRNPIYTAFVDFGESSISVSTFKMWNGTIQAVDHSFDKSLGGQDFTDYFCSYLVNKTIKKYRVDPRSNKKQFIRFMKECEKIKRALSINSSMIFDCQSIGGVDISFTVQRTEFEDCCAPLIRKLNVILNESARQTPRKFSFVEVIGGATRPPIVKQAIQKAYNCELRQSMNVEECVACGAAHTTHTSSNVIDIIGSPIFISYRSLTGKTTVETLFSAGSKFNSTEKKNISIKSNIIRLINEKGQFATIDIKNRSDKINLVATLDQNGLLAIKEVKDILSNRNVQFDVVNNFGYDNIGDIKAMRAFCDAAFKREEMAKEAEIARGNLEVELMKRPQKDAQLWFEEHEFELMEKSDYLYWINLIKSGKANIAQIRTLQSRASRVLNACCCARSREASLIADETAAFIQKLSANEKNGCISVHEAELTIKDLENRARKYMKI